MSTLLWEEKEEAKVLRRIEILEDSLTEAKMELQCVYYRFGMKRKVVDRQDSDKEKIKDIQNVIAAEENAADSPKKPRMASSTEENAADSPKKPATNADLAVDVEKAKDIQNVIGSADSPKKPATNADLAVDVEKAKDIQNVIGSEVPTKKPSDVDVKKDVKGHAEYAAK